MVTNTSETNTSPVAGRTDRRIAAALFGLAAILVCLQGLWAGIFLSYDDRPDNWVEVHDTGAWVTFAVVVLAAVWVTWRLRSDRLLWAGSVLLVVLIAAEAHLGGMITDDGDDSLTAVHVPLAMLILAFIVWLPMRSLRVRNETAA